jgi:hypothetical protein
MRATHPLPFSVEHPRLVLLRASLLRLAPVRDPGASRAHGRPTRVGGPKRAFRRIPLVRGVLLHRSSVSGRSRRRPVATRLRRASACHPRATKARSAAPSRERTAFPSPGHLRRARAPSSGTFPFTGLAARSRSRCSSRRARCPALAAFRSRGFHRHEVPTTGTARRLVQLFTRPMDATTSRDPRDRAVGSIRAVRLRAPAGRSRTRYGVAAVSPAAGVTRMPLSPLRPPRGREAPRFLRLDRASV